MKVFIVGIQRKTTQIDDFNIEAKDPKDAIKKAEDMYSQGLRMSGEVKEQVVTHITGVVGEDE